MTCPGCGAAAEITERFTLASTDGPVAHVALSCAGGHHYRMAADKLLARPLSQRDRPPEGHPADPPRVPPHTFPLCIHCRQTPPGSGSAARTTRSCSGRGACPAARSWTGPHCHVTRFSLKMYEVFEPPR